MINAMLSAILMLWSKLSWHLKCSQFFSPFFCVQSSGLNSRYKYHSECWVSFFLSTIYIYIIYIWLCYQAVYPANKSLVSGELVGLLKTNTGVICDLAFPKSWTLWWWVLLLGELALCWWDLTPVSPRTHTHTHTHTHRTQLPASWPHKEAVGFHSCCKWALTEAHDLRAAFLPSLSFSLPFFSLVLSLALLFFFFPRLSFLRESLCGSEEAES